MKLLSSQAEAEHKHYDHDMFIYDRPYHYKGRKRLIFSDAVVFQGAICDRCGANLVKPLRDHVQHEEQKKRKEAEAAGAVLEPEPYTVDSASFDYSAGYTSPWDGDVWHADLCPACALKVKDLINQGSGPGVQTENDQWGPVSDEDWAYTAPFSEEQIARYHGEQYCRYHTDQQLILTESGLVCPLEYCDEDYWYVGKDQFQ